MKPSETLTPEGIQKEFSICINQEQIDQLLNHVNLLLEKNTHINLTAVRDFEAAVDLHVKDSLSIIRTVNHSKLGAYLDIGTGGGFPGVPIGIVTDRKGVLLDSTKKKVDAVQEFLDALGLSPRVKAEAARAEDYARKHAGEFAVVTARAVSSLPSIIELAAPFLSKGGRLILMKGQPEAEEVERGAKVAKMLGLKHVETQEFVIGENQATRTILIYEKTGKSSVKLPRRVGLAQHQPLA